MDNKTFAGWMSIGVMLALILGFMMGVGASKARPASEPQIRATGAPIPPTENEQLKELLEKTTVAWKDTIEHLAACNAQYSESTILLSTGGGPFALNVSPLTGRFGLSTEGSVRGIWVIPQRVRRVLAVNPTGSEFFYYTDLHTGKLDGPYVPLPATPKIWADSQ